MILPIVGLFFVLYGLVALIAGILGANNNLLSPLAATLGIPIALIALAIIAVGVGLFLIAKRAEDPVTTPLLGDRMQALGPLGCLIAVGIPIACLAAFFISYAPIR